MMNPKKRCELDTILNLLVQGKNRKQIIKELGIKKSALSNNIKRLEDSNNIKRVGKYEIQIISSSHSHPRVTKNKVHKEFNKRGHAHNIKVHFNKNIKLKEKPKVKQDKKAKILTELSFGSLKLVKDGFTIWINKNNLTLYSNNSYYSKNALHSKFKALRDVDNLIQKLISKYDFPTSYGIEVFREHYGLIFNKFATWLNKNGKKMYIQDKKGKNILWVDKSRKDDIGLNEFEGEDPVKINNADTFFDSHDKQKWKVDADFTLNAINKLVGALASSQSQLLEYKEQNKEHLALIQGYREESIVNRKFMKELIKKMKEKKHL